MVKTIPKEMQDDLTAGVTTHCYGWVLKRVDGVVMGFTDHDRDLPFEDETGTKVSLKAETGLSPSAQDSTTGLGVDNMDVIGILDSLSLSESDLALGLFDGAVMTAYRINWQNTEHKVILLKGSIGEVTRGSIAFNAEVRGLAHNLNQPTGRQYNPQCDANLGDSRCKASIPIQPTDVTKVLSQSSILVDMNGTTFAQDFFSRGLAEWQTGENDGQRIEIKSFILVGVVTGLGSRTQYRVDFWEQMPFPILVADRLSLAAGCDKTIETCKNKFDNIINFQGFPRMPGTQALARVAKADGRHDGKSLFK